MIISLTPRSCDYYSIFTDRGEANGRPVRASRFFCFSNTQAGGILRLPWPGLAKLPAHPGLKILGERGRGRDMGIQEFLKATLNLNFFDLFEA